MLKLTLINESINTLEVMYLTNVNKLNFIVKYYHIKTIAL